MIPDFWKLCLGFCAFDRFLAKPRESSACLEAAEGKSSPNKKRLALGSGWSARFTFSLLIIVQREIPLLKFVRLSLSFRFAFAAKFVGWNPKIFLHLKAGDLEFFCLLGGLSLSYRSWWREGERERWHLFRFGIVFYDWKGQISLKYLQMFPSLWLGCRYSWKGK